MTLARSAIDSQNRVVPVPFGTGSVSRRRFIEGLLAAAASGVAACSNPLSGSSGSEALGAEPATSGTAGPADGSDPEGRLVAGAVDDRVLVVVDLQGGNDGLSTLVPYSSGRYHDLRPNLAVPDEEVLVLDDEVGLHPSLSKLKARGLTTVEGVGPVDGDLSHFSMTARWQRGDVSGAESGLRTGFLGRLVDTLDDGSPLVGLSLGSPTTHLTNRAASTMSFGSADELWFLQSDADWVEAALFSEQLSTFGLPEGAGGSAATELIKAAGGSYRDLVGLATELPESDGIDWEHPMIAEGGDVGWKLYTAADVIGAGVGTRVVYVSTGDYDTHDGHAYRQMGTLAALDAAVDGFLTRADELGFADRVAVATISEFGRRVPENDGGLDHGSASTMLVAGPVGDVRAGERPPLDDLDEDDNLRTMIGFDRYLASIAQEWLGVEASSVLPGDPEPLGLF